MIIDDKHKFAFIHIPKCAGTSVKSKLEAFDTTEGEFRPHIEDLEGVGRFDFTHLPLSFLRNHYSEYYEKIVFYQSFVVIRDPYKRFSSSLYQRLAMYGEKPVKDMTKDEFKIVLDEHIDFLLKNRNVECLPYDYIHSQKQSTYVFDRGERLIKHLYTTGKINQLLEDIGGIVNASFAFSERVPHSNQAVFYKSPFFSYFARILLPLYSESVQRLLPTVFKNWIKSFFYQSKDEKIKDLFEADYVRAFINDYYEEDIRLYNSVVALEK